MAASLRRVTTSVGAKLFTLVLLVLVLSLGLLGYVNVRLHREHLQVSRVNDANRLNDVIRRSASYYMLRNDRAALQHMVDSVGQQPTITGLRIYNAQRRIGFSSVRSEVGKVMPEMPAPGTRVEMHDGERVLGIVTPVLNSPTCSSAACHAHPASQHMLGILDTQMSLATADADVRAATWQFVFYSALAIMIVLVATALFVWRFVHRPVTALREGTERLARGELGVQIPVQTSDELGSLGGAFNRMSTQLCDARQEITAWNHTLEERVQRKTDELQRAQEQMIQAEKLTSLGKLAAVVAHEVNNPLSGILTYAKLMRKWIDRGDDLYSRSAEMRDALALIEAESKRCGEIVRSLLTFARAAPMNMSEVDVNALVRVCIKLVEHKLELGNIVPDLELDPDLPLIRGDAGHIEQVLLALIMNAIEAMPREGNLRVTTSKASPNAIRITVEDDGTGIDPAILSRLFDPFVTTKEEKGVGLGLAISRSIVDRHRGRIEVQSEPGRGTTFTITLPVGDRQPSQLPVPEAEPEEVTA